MKWGAMMTEFEYKFYLWQFDVVANFNRTTQLVRNRNTKQLMIKKIMPASEFDLHITISKLNNEHIAKIFDVIIDRNACIILEEYVPGNTVEQMISKGVFSENYAINVARQICDGLSVLHKYSITHRDITPTNIIIGNNGVVKIIDFGISRFHNANASHDTQVLGTEGYAAPEQFGFKQSDSKTDIYAVGVLLNFMLTGHLPSEVMYRNGDIAEIIKKCTEFNVEKRFETIEDLNAALKRKRVYGFNFADNFLENFPGFRSKKKGVRIFAIIMYAYMFLWIANMYRTYCPQNLLNIFPVTLISIMMFIIPIAFFSNIFGFQNCIPKIRDLNKTARRIIFFSLAVVSIFVGAALFRDFTTAADMELYKSLYSTYNDLYSNYFQ